MKLTKVLIWYSVVRHTPRGHTAGPHDAKGAISCRLRTYLHEDGQDPRDGEAIREESIILKDNDFSANWSEVDLCRDLSLQLKTEVVDGGA